MGLDSRLKKLETKAKPGKCRHCLGVVLRVDPDGSCANEREWREYEAGCPACGLMPPTIRMVWDDEDERGT